MYTTFDIVTIGSAVLDILLRSSQFIPHKVEGELMICEIYGGKANVEEAALSSGGAATNTAVGFARQGLRTAIIAEMGKDASAQFIIDELIREGVEVSMLIEEEGEQTGMSAILVASDGSRSAMTFRGASHQLSPQDIPFDALKKVPWIHLSSIGNTDLIRQIFFFCEEQGIQLSWNPSMGELEDILLRSGRSYEDVCRVLFINDQEFARVARMEEKLIKMTRNLVVTRGKFGGDVYEKDRTFHYESVTVSKVVSELGAGDAFASGCIGALLKGKHIEDAVTQGTKNSASVIQHLGAKKGLLSFS